MSNVKATIYDIEKHAERHGWTRLYSGDNLVVWLMPNGRVLEVVYAAGTEKPVMDVHAKEHWSHG